jgi:hypothetical protein
MMHKCLGLFQKKRRVIVRLTLNLCQLLLDTEIRLPPSELRMPYPVMGAALPASLRDWLGLRRCEGSVNENIPDSTAR